jgi:transposase
VRAAQLEQLNLNAAGIDVGATEHWGAVPADRDESTGVYWIALFEVLEERGFDVKLVDAHQARQVPGRKTDVKDCQWLQELHTYG